MKVGDNIPVSIAGQVVAQAVVKEMDKDTATLVVPATLVVMAVRTELATAPVEEKEVETVITGVESPNVEDAVSSETQSAAVDETTEQTTVAQTTEQSTAQTTEQESSADVETQPVGEASVETSVATSSDEQA